MYGDDDVAGNDGLTTMDATVDELRSGDDCARTINSTSAINHAAVEAAPTTRRPPPIADWLGLTIPPPPPSTTTMIVPGGATVAVVITSARSCPTRRGSSDESGNDGDVYGASRPNAILVRVRVGGALLPLPCPPHPPEFSSMMVSQKGKITGFSSVKPPLPSSHNIICVRVRVDGVLVFPDPPDFHSRRDDFSSRPLPSASRIQEIGCERCSVPPSECDLYHQRTHLCVSSGDSCRTRVEQNVSHHHHPIFVSPGVPTPWVKVYRSKASSSVRTQCASIAHTKTVSYKAFHRRSLRASKKKSKQQHLLREVIVPTNQFKMTPHDIHDQITVIDGGCHNNPPILPPDGVHWRCIHISELHIDDELNPAVGLMFPRINNALAFIRLPRGMSLEIIGHSGLHNMYNALDACEGLRKRPSVRSKSKQVFGDYGKPIKFVCMGVHVSRASKEVMDCAPFMQSLPNHHWKSLMKIMHRAETCFEQIMDHQVISHIRHAKTVVPYRTMTSATHSPPLKYFGGLAYGRNVFLPCHTDDDFTMSMVQIFLKDHPRCQIDDEIVVHFCFPTLGVAVPLRPGDFLMFNALIPHCISSRCKQSDDVIALTMYLKTAVVGMNNNNLDLTPEQTALVSSRNHL